MRIIGLNFKKIEAERKKEIQGKLEIKSNLQVEDLKKDFIDLAGDILQFHFIYSINYNPDFAQISFHGAALVVPDTPEDLKKILKDWKNKKLSEDLRIFVYNFIMAKCNLKALQLEEDLALPPHIPLPRLSKPQPQTPSKEQTNYTG